MACRSGNPPDMYSANYRENRECQNDSAQHVSAMRMQIPQVSTCAYARQVSYPSAREGNRLDNTY
ncbi:hypothetical protein EV664_10241 [Stakelama pacifica]|uniref:Uncharacterized protein n=1 Tax=Stakelama pacifica TaxID=517720 RepID=A0A4R6FU00_9SPHN|nr:hypothetical protein EV664_10241 [Stakelama pacifica]